MPRPYSPWAKCVAFQIHTFSDASNAGYGVGIYARSSADNKIFDCRLMFGKSRVIPQGKEISMPRAELVGALTAVRITKMITESLEIPISSVWFWCDSITVLRYIRSVKIRFKKWVAKRVEEIRDFAKPDLWRYVPSKLNSADLPSRGLSPRHTDRPSLWFHGPAFSRESNDNWNFDPPNSSDISAQAPLLDILPEVTVSSAITNPSSETFPLVNLVNYYSNLHDLLRAISILLCFVSFMKHKYVSRLSDGISKTSFKKKKFLPDPIQGYSYALVQAAKIAQFEAYGNILNVVKTTDFSTAMKKCNNPTLKHQLNALRNLRPFVSTEDGVMRVNGRLRHAPIAYNAKYPIILPKDGHFTKLVIEHFHKITGCSGYNTTLAATRQHFWIVNGPTTVKRYTRTCVKFRERDAKPLEQVMAPLPEVRLATGKLPFTASSVDYFGPFSVAIGRRREKRWGVIFTCLAVRAVHFEVAHSLTTSSFLNAYVRFICERGYAPSRMYSDNGSNLKGGYTELKEGLKRLDSKKIHRKLAERSVTWIFSPPSASHQNGPVERMIRSTRRILWTLNENGRKTPSDEQFLTFIKEVQSILNARPLVPTSQDPTDFSAISPMTILTGVLDPRAPLDISSTGDQLRNSWKWAQANAEQFWDLFIKEYIPSLIKTQKWLSPKPNLKENDLVLILDNSISTVRGNYPKALVTKTFPDMHGHVRRAELRLSDGRVFFRDIRKIALLEAS